jgi:orotidine-5'-phosphate decarboxylase
MKPTFNPIFVALDTPSLEKARALCEQMRGGVGGVKLGLEFFCANGPAGVERILELGFPVFLDLKLHDIPNTVGKAVAALAALEPAVLTVHVAGGRAMMEAARAAAAPGTKVVGVTVLTSLDGEDLRSTGIRSEPGEQVERLAEFARSSGLDGIVCSGAEVGAARAAWPDGFFVVPGVRPAGSTSADQKRVVTPRQALDNGASILVIGRPITAAPDSAIALRDIAATMQDWTSATADA